MSSRHLTNHIIKTNITKYVAMSLSHQSTSQMMSAQNHAINEWGMICDGLSHQTERWLTGHSKLMMVCYWLMGVELEGGGVTLSRKFRSVVT